MRIVSDARRIVVLSYSFWAQVLGLAALILPELAFGFWGIETDPYVLWWIGAGRRYPGAAALESRRARHGNCLLLCPANAA